MQLKREINWFLIRKKLSQVRLVFLDVDGVLTDAGMYYTESGDEFKKFCTYDGMAFQILQKKSPSWQNLERILLTHLYLWL